MMTGRVPITRICKAYTNLLKKVSYVYMKSVGKSVIFVFVKLTQIYWKR